MSVGLLDQLDAYFAEFDEQQGSITDDQVAELLDRVRELPKPIGGADRPSSPPWLPAAVAAGIVAVVVGLVPLLAALRQDEAPPVTEPLVSTTTVTNTSSTVTTTSPGETTSSEPSLTTTQGAPSALSWDWDVVAFDRGEGPQHGSVSATRNEILVLQRGLEAYEVTGAGATRGQVDLDGDLRDILWVSSDGRTWQENVLSIPGAPVPLIANRAHGIFVVSTEDGTYLSENLQEWTRWDEIPGAIFGLASTDDAVIGYRWNAIYRSEPGFANTQILENPFGESGDGGIHGVAVSSSTFYAVTYSNTTESTSVWSSADGLTWTVEIDQQPGFPGGFAANAERLLVEIGDSVWGISEDGSERLIVGPRGHLVATDHGFLSILTSGFGSGRILPSVWRHSTDGKTWESIEQLSLPAEQVAALGNTVFAQMGEWTIDLDDDGRVSGERWTPDGRWLIGNLQPNT